MVIGKANKSNTTVILNKNDYILRLNQILGGNSKIKKLHKVEGKAVNYIIHMRECIINLLKSLKNQNENAEKSYDYLYLSGSKPEMFEELCKIHKVDLEDGILTFRTVL